MGSDALSCLRTQTHPRDMALETLPSSGIDRKSARRTGAIFPGWGSDRKTNIANQNGISRGVPGKGPAQKAKTNLVRRKGQTARDPGS
jgi:hypothetical protein